MCSVPHDHRKDWTGRAGDPFPHCTDGQWRAAYTLAFFDPPRPRAAAHCRRRDHRPGACGPGADGHHRHPADVPNGQLDMGLIFVAFNQDIRRQFVAMQNRLINEPQWTTSNHTAEATSSLCLAYGQPATGSAKDCSKRDRKLRRLRSVGSRNPRTYSSLALSPGAVPGNRLGAWARNCPVRERPQRLAPGPVVRGGLCSPVRSLLLSAAWGSLRLGRCSVRPSMPRGPPARPAVRGRRERLGGVSRRGSGHWWRLCTRPGGRLLTG